MRHIDPATGINILSSRDETITPFARKLLSGFYLRPDESPQEGYARACAAWSGGDKSLAQRLYEYVSQGWFMFASPVLSNAPLPGEKIKNMPISCFLAYTPDSIDGLNTHTVETRWLSVLGGGVGGHWSDVRSVSNKAPGPIPFLHTMNADMDAYAQGVTRKGSYAAYLDVSHPDIVEFISIRKVGGDDNRRCFSKGFHHGVNITDTFMQAVMANGPWDLIDPHDKTVRDTVPARHLWEELLETRYRLGEPYLYFIDAANRALPKSQRALGLTSNGSNLCVAPGTNILTRNGYFPISQLKDQTVDVWNGKEWSETVVRQTGVAQELIKVLLSDGSALECTPYHKFYLQDGYMHAKSLRAVNSRKILERRAGELKPGDAILKFSLPVVQGGDDVQHSYASGFLSADGTHDGRGHHLTWLYGDKRNLATDLLIDGAVFRSNDGGERDSIRYPDGALLPKFQVPINGSLRSRLEWLAGYCDGDGTISRNGTNESLQMASVNVRFLEDIRLLLNTLGVQPKLAFAKAAGAYMLPDGHGAMREYECQEVYRILVSSGDLQRLVALGFAPRRLRITPRTVQRDANHLVKVVAVEYTGRHDDTYCFTEAKRHMGVFNGILTGNCSEITLATSADRTAVCCLSSLNAEHFDAWRDTTIVADLIVMLDNVLEFFIQNAPAPLERAAYSAQRERALGLGVMGFHAYLQRNNVAFESKMARVINRDMFQRIKIEAIASSHRMAIMRGEPEDMRGTGMRNSHLLALAPNANSGILIGTSPSIEPAAANAYLHETRAGAFPVKNRYLEALLRSYERDDAATWQSITLNKGSVQHLEFLSDHERLVYKTAIEIDQSWIVQHAADRTPYICQSQSVNLFFPAKADRATFNAVHLQAWEQGLKSLYYCRSLASSRADAVSVKIEREALADATPEVADGDDEGCRACEG